MRRKPRREDGVATLELALVSTLILTLIAFIVPLGILFVDKLRLERAAHQTARFYAQQPGTCRADVPACKGGDRSNTALTATDADAVSYAHAVYDGGGTLTSVVPSETPADPSDTTNPANDCASGVRRTVELHLTVELGGLGGLLSFVDGSSTNNLTATASDCKE